MAEIQRVAVIGAGTMGRQIALQVARSGLPVALYDIDQGAIAAARLAQREFVATWIASGVLAPAAEAALFACLSYTTDLDLAVKDADLAIEVAPERARRSRSM